MTHPAAPYAAFSSASALVSFKATALAKVLAFIAASLPYFQWTAAVLAAISAALSIWIAIRHLREKK